MNIEDYKDLIWKIFPSEKGWYIWSHQRVKFPYFGWLLPKFPLVAWGKTIEEALIDLLDLIDNNPN